MPKIDKIKKDIFIKIILLLCFVEIKKNLSRIVNFIFFEFFGSGKYEINKGKIEKELIKISDKDKIIIKPKSIIGLISDISNDAKATIVVNTVYIQGQTILFNVKERDFGF